MEHLCAVARALVPRSRARQDAMPAVAKKAKPLTRAQLCQELLEIERDNATLFTRMDEIKAALKLDAEKAGSFRENIAGLGYVSVSPPAPKRTVGEEPVLQVDAWQKLKPAERKALLKQGLVAVMAIVKGAFYGRVEAKLLTTPQGASS